MIPMKSTATNWRMFCTALSISLTACKGCQRFCILLNFTGYDQNFTDDDQNFTGDDQNFTGDDQNFAGDDQVFWPCSANSCFQHFREPLHLVPGMPQQNRPGSWQCVIYHFHGFVFRCASISARALCHWVTHSLTDAFWNCFFQSNISDLRFDIQSDSISDSENRSEIQSKIWSESFTPMQPSSILLSKSVSNLMGRTTSITCPNIRLVKPSPASSILPVLNRKLVYFGRTLLS